RLGEHERLAHVVLGYGRSDVDHPFDEQAIELCGVFLDPMPIPAIEVQFGECATVEQHLARDGLFPATHPVDADAAKLEMLCVRGLMQPHVELNAHAAALADIIRNVCVPAPYSAMHAAS